MDLELDEPHSWPQAITDLLARFAADIDAFDEEEKRIDRLGREDVLLQINRPVNAFRPKYEHAISVIEKELAQHRIVGYHATRLTVFERESIRTGGLKRLSSEFMEQRWAAAVHSGDLTTGVHAQLRVDPLVQQSLTPKSGRIDRVYLASHRSQLQDASGVYPLLRSWGGEAIYRGQEETDLGSVLRRIGRPTILRCALSVDDLAPTSWLFPLARRLFTQWRHVGGPGTRSPVATDLMLYVDVPASNVLDIVSDDDPRFDRWTGRNAWEAPFRDLG